ncbi:MAG TPA: hypothetical protein VJL90_15990 [Pseudorhodoplanes sp.]|nr:hypothetical protein [Pseudorhodoplanes sp.]
MPNLDYKWALLILLILSPSAYFVFTRNSDAPKGEWVSQYVGGCQKTALRFRFGDDIMLTNGKDSQPFATDALYHVTPNGQLQMAFIQRKADRVLDIAILYDRTADRLVPKAIRINKGVTHNKMPPELAENYTFTKCPSANS